MPTRSERRTQAERVAASSARLQDAFAALVAEQGYTSTTAAAIGERAGLSRAMVRERYGSKEALLQALHREYEARLLDAPEPPPTTALDRALAGVDRLRSFAAERPLVLRAIFVVSFEAVGAAPGFRPTVERWLDALHAQAATWLRDGRADGSVRADLDPDDEARRFVDEALADAYRWVLRPEAVDYDAGLERWRAVLRRRWAQDDRRTV